MRQSDPLFPVYPVTPCKFLFLISRYSRSRLFSLACIEGNRASSLDSHLAPREGTRRCQNGDCTAGAREIRGRAGVGGGCPRHHGSACIPSEPPSLAHPTTRAMAAEKGNPSL